MHHAPDTTLGSTLPATSVPDVTLDDVRAAKLVLERARAAHAAAQNALPSASGLHAQRIRRLAKAITSVVTNRAHVARTAVPTPSPRATAAVNAAHAALHIAQTNYARRLDAWVTRRASALMAADSDTAELISIYNQRIRQLLERERVADQLYQSLVRTRNAANLHNLTSEPLPFADALRETASLLAALPPDHPLRSLSAAGAGILSSLSPTQTDFSSPAGAQNIFQLIYQLDAAIGPVRRELEAASVALAKSQASLESLRAVYVDQAIEEI